MESKPLQRLMFGHRPEHIKAALGAHGDDIRRMKACLHDAGYDVSVEDLVAAWLSRSDAVSAKWLTPPSSNRRLLATLLKGKGQLLRVTSSYSSDQRVSLLDVDDGSGDQIFKVPDDLVVTLGWSVDDLLELSRLPNGDLRLHKPTSSS